MLRVFITALSLVIMLAGCTASPMGRQQFRMLPDDQLAQMGSQAFLQMRQKMPVETDPRANQFVVCVAEAVVRETGGRWEVALFRDQSANAFALPGGKIGVNTGIFQVARNQDQLATVLAHEVAHVLAKHTNERMSQEMAVQQGMGLLQVLSSATSPQGQMLMGVLGLGAQYGILMPYGRTQESEADLYGLDLMARAGFDPRQSIDLWTNMQAVGQNQPLEFLSTHPAHATRIKDLEQRMPHAMQLSQQAIAQGKRPQCDNLLR